MASPTAAPASEPRTAPRIPALLNPASPNASAARKALEECGRFDVIELIPSRVRDQIDEVLDNGARRVLVAGGDGTLGTAAAALLERNAEIAVLPAGTRNHFAKDHGIPESLADALQAALADHTERVDVGIVSERVFLNTASVGLYVSYVRARERMERYAGYRIASALAFLRLMLSPPAISVELNVGGVTKRYRTPLLFVGVGERELKAPKFGGRVEGGKRGLHVIVVRGRRPARLFAMALAAAARGVRELASTPQLDSFVVESCTVRVGYRRSIVVGLDGELMRVPIPLEFMVRHDALRVVSAQKPADVPTARNE